MKHTESSVKVYFTRNYDLFKDIKGNRNLNLRKIEKIKEDIASGLDVLKYCPIIVNELGGGLYVVDGQHRLQVARELKSHVWYVIAEHLELSDIAKINSKTEKWKPKDFINCYAQQGNKHYKVLHQFVEDYGFPLSVSVQLLTEGGQLNDSGTETMGAFHEGKFKVVDEKEARRLGDIMMSFEGFAGRRSRPFVVAVCKIMGAAKIEIEEVVKEYLKNPEQLKTCGTWKEYLGAIEAVVNYGKSKRRVIY